MSEGGEPHEPVQINEVSQIVRLGNVKEKAGIGKVPVRFLWNAEPKEFGGFDRQGLIDLSQHAAEFFHIEPQDREKIHVFFGDHTSVIYPDGRTITPGNIAIPGYRRDGTVDDVTVVMNRSHELHDKNDGGENNEPPRAEDVEISQYGFIGLQLRYPWEGVAWRVAEEINHAGVALKLGTHEKVKEARLKFDERARYHHRNMMYVEPYSLNLMEVTAARQVLRLLKGLAGQRAPEREPIYEQALQASLDNRFAVLPGYEQIKGETFVNTGYNSAKPIT